MDQLLIPLYHSEFFLSSFEVHNFVQLAIAVIFCQIVQILSLRFVQYYLFILPALVLGTSEAAMQSVLSVLSCKYIV